MTRILPKAAEPLEATPRKAMTLARRHAVLTAYNHACGRLDCEEMIGLEIDHIVPLELGGEDTIGNLWPLCKVHHKAKTVLDIKLIARARRLRAKDLGQPREPSRLKSAGFRAWRTFSGSIVRRRESLSPAPTDGEVK